ncbi:MAG: pyruvate, phosphate dikinase [Phycisphaerales bacterium]|nr:pyruvate, phosphate dikinase [Phycisphaerales bacterium]
MANKLVYFFGNGKAEGSAKDKVLLGGKGANLAEMTNIGLPVPPGFTITTECCAAYYKSGQQFPQGLEEQIDDNIRRLEAALGKKLGDANNPLLVSCRSGAAVSMPGMMDTVLNIGLTEKMVAPLAAKSANPRFVWDAWRRLINMFGDTVMGVDHHHFEHELSAVKAKRKVKLDTDLDIAGLQDVCSRYLKVYEKHTKQKFPTDPREQILKSVKAVFQSWMSDRAIKYRAINEISGLAGTAVNVQAMVFGNMGDDCATGVCFTRDPSTGENVFYGEFLINAQGEDVVAGIRTPQPIERMGDTLPEAYAELLRVKDVLEKHFRDVQDMEFTVEHNHFYMLQTRNGKRTAQAAVRIAVEMVKERLIDQNTALLRVDPSSLDQLLHPSFDPKAKRDQIAKGLPASPGAAVGKLAFTAEEAETRHAAGEKVILVRKETSPEDIGGMQTATGILTSTGGMTSHAAVVARGMGKPCVAGCGELNIDAKAGSVTIRSADGKTRKFGRKDVISLDGSTGIVYAGAVPTVKPAVSGDFSTLMQWADATRKLAVRTNADTPNDARVAREFGAQGIGLCRTEHMFFEGDRIVAMREMILAENEKDRRAALKKLLPYQKKDFVGIFKAMDGLPVTIRLLDPPLHEFLPHEDKNQREMARQMKVPLDKIKRRVTELHEANPMLGFRGCRLAVIFPEIQEMQVRAIFMAACEVAAKGVKVQPEVMIPIVNNVKELEFLLPRVHAVAQEVFAKAKRKIEYKVGTMIELPRAAVTADAIATQAEFFSFGTNDLTQMTFGFSRDDVASFVPKYVELEILPKDPFNSLDQTGVGQLIEMAIQKGRKTRPDLKVGICGEHGGDPSSVEFCHRSGLNYVSCSPYRVPIARLAAAQAVVREKTGATYSTK